MLVYATSDDLTAWMTSAPPTDPTGILRTASLLVRKATKAALYAVDSDGLPTDAATLQAFKDATCAHAAALATAKVDTNAGGVLKAGTAVSKSIGSANITYADATKAAAAKAALLEQLAPEAADILAQAGVIPSAPWVFG